VLIAKPAPHTNPTHHLMDFSIGVTTFLAMCATSACGQVLSIDSNPRPRLATPRVCRSIV
jgi:hypothetical protein